MPRTPPPRGHGHGLCSIGNTRQLSILSPGRANINMKNLLSNTKSSNFSILRVTKSKKSAQDGAKNTKSFLEKTFALIYVFSICSLFSLPALAQAAGVIITWDRNQEPDIAGYRIFYGTQTGHYINIITIYDSADQPIERSYAVVGLNVNTTYYIALQAFDQAGQESAVSAELSAYIYSSSTSDNYSYDIFDTSLFVEQQYRDFLGREIDAQGLIFWQELLDTGALTKAELVQGFLHCPETQSSIAAIIRLYSAFFNRIPDYDGLIYWCMVYRDGVSLVDIYEFFSQSPEFVTIYGTLDNASYVIQIYRNVLEREPDAEGLAFWTNMLDSGQLARGELMLGFSESEEYRAKELAEVDVILLYVSMLRRVPDVEGFDYWVSLLNDGFPCLELVNIFLESPKYLDRFN